jgi:hypothetical protein
VPPAAAVVAAAAHCTRTSAVERYLHGTVENVSLSAGNLHKFRDFENHIKYSNRQQDMIQFSFLECLL